MIERLRFVIRTPHEVVFDADVRAARVPAQSGQVGLRPRGEPCSLVVEPGLLLLHVPEGERFAASAGGLLECERDHAELYTPFAAVGEHGEQVLAELDRALAIPGSALAARRRLAELEQRIVRELRRGPLIGTKAVRHG